MMIVPRVRRISCSNHTNLTKELARTSHHQLQKLLSSLRAKTTVFRSNALEHAKARRSRALTRVKMSIMTVCSQLNSSKRNYSLSPDLNQCQTVISNLERVHRPFRKWYSCLIASDASSNLTASLPILKSQLRWSNVVNWLISELLSTWELFSDSVILSNAGVPENAKST